MMTQVERARRRPRSYRTLAVALRNARTESRVKPRLFPLTPFPSTRLVPPIQNPPAPPLWPPMLGPVLPAPPTSLRPPSRHRPLRRLHRLPPSLPHRILGHPRANRLQGRQRTWLRTAWPLRRCPVRSNKLRRPLLALAIHGRRRQSEAEAWRRSAPSALQEVQSARCPAVSDPPGRSAGSASALQLRSSAETHGVAFRLLHSCSSSPTNLTRRLWGQVPSSPRPSRRLLRLSPCHQHHLLPRRPLQLQRRSRRWGSSEHSSRNGATANSLRVRLCSRRTVSTTRRF
mmetsp:Transcript_6333/g.16026  ORF Transcript_6333/g.16026 Transcript_6333/m.16026 type:complete len:287 (+) Transcript_6333:2477-3337(+)